MTNSIHPKNKMQIDYLQYDRQTQRLKPAVYKKGNAFYALSGPDPETGIYGSGETPDAAIRSWREALQQRFDRLHSEHMPEDRTWKNKSNVNET